MEEEEEINVAWMVRKRVEIEDKENSIHRIYDLKLQEELVHAYCSAAGSVMAMVGYLATPFTTNISMAVITYSIGNICYSLFGKLGAINRGLKIEKDELKTTVTDIEDLGEGWSDDGASGPDDEVQTLGNRIPKISEVYLTLIITRVGWRYMGGLGRLKSLGRAKIAADKVLLNILRKITNAEHDEHITNAVKTPSTFGKEEFVTIETNIIESESVVNKISLINIFGVSISVLSFVYYCYNVYVLKAKIAAGRNDPETVELRNAANRMLMAMAAIIETQVHANDDSDDNEYDNNYVVDDKDDDKDDIDNFNNR